MLRWLKEFFLWRILGCGPCAGCGKIASLTKIIEHYKNGNGDGSQEVRYEACLCADCLKKRVASA